MKNYFKVFALMLLIFGATFAQQTNKVRVVYIVPSDKVVNASYNLSLTNGIASVQNFYLGQLGRTFSTGSVEVQYSTLPTSYFTTPSSDIGMFFSRVSSEGFNLVKSVPTNDTKWLFYIDVIVPCEQRIGTQAGSFAVFGAGDLMGLSGQPIITCTGQWDGGVYPQTGRWIGGMAHELGHAFGLVHPQGCDAGQCINEYARLSLMYSGYQDYPNTYFIDSDKTLLLNTGFFTQQTVTVGGHVYSPDGQPLRNVTVQLTNNVTGVVTSATTSSFGIFTFDSTSLGDYTLAVNSRLYRFPNTGLHVVNNITQDIYGAE